MAQSLAQACRQGQAAGRCTIFRRARDASRAGTAIMVASTVAIRAAGVSAATAAARKMLKVITANPSQAPTPSRQRTRTEDQSRSSST